MFRKNVQMELKQTEDRIQYIVQIIPLVSVQALSCPDIMSRHILKDISHTLSLSYCYIISNDSSCDQAVQ